MAKKTLLQKTLLAIAAGGMGLSTGCISLVSFVPSASPAQEKRSETLADHLMNKTKKEGVVYSTLKNRDQLRYEAAFYQGKIFNLLGVIDVDGDRDKDSMFLFACETDRTDLPKANSDFEKFAAKMEGTMHYELIDDGANGTCEYGNMVLRKLLNQKTKGGLRVQEQELYHEMVWKYNQFYAEK